MAAVPRSVRDFVGVFDGFLDTIDGVGAEPDASALAVALTGGDGGGVVGTLARLDDDDDAAAFVDDDEVERCGSYAYFSFKDKFGDDRRLQRQLGAARGVQAASQCETVSKVVDFVCTVPPADEQGGGALEFTLRDIFEAGIEADAEWAARAIAVERDILARLARTMPGQNADDERYAAKTREIAREAALRALVVPLSDSECASRNAEEAAKKQHDPRRCVFSALNLELLENDTDAVVQLYTTLQTAMSALVDASESGASTREAARAGLLDGATPFVNALVEAAPREHLSPARCELAYVRPRYLAEQPTVCAFTHMTPERLLNGVFALEPEEAGMTPEERAAAKKRAGEARDAARRDDEEIAAAQRIECARVVRTCKPAERRAAIAAVTTKYDAERARRAAQRAAAVAPARAAAPRETWVVMPDTLALAYFIRVNQRALGVRVEEHESHKDKKEEKKRRKQRTAETAEPSRFIHTRYEVAARAAQALGSAHELPYCDPLDLAFALRGAFKPEHAGQRVRVRVRVWYVLPPRESAITPRWYWTSAGFDVNARYAQMRRAGPAR